MTAIVKNKIDRLMSNVITLSRAGRYGEAVCQFNNVFLSSDEELKRAIKDAMQEKEMEDHAIEQCCACCSECKCDGLASLYCMGVMVTVICCGSDVASSCCGCDWMSDACVSGTRSCAGC